MLRPINTALTLPVLSMPRCQRCCVRSKNGLTFIIDLVDELYMCPLCVKHQAPSKSKIKVRICARSSNLSTMTNTQNHVLKCTSVAFARRILELERSPLYPHGKEDGPICTPTPSMIAADDEYVKEMKRIVREGP